MERAHLPSRLLFDVYSKLVFHIEANDFQRSKSIGQPQSANALNVVATAVRIIEWPEAIGYPNVDAMIEQKTGLLEIDRQ
jgi:hypothetical protein